VAIGVENRAAVGVHGIRQTGHEVPGDRACSPQRPGVLAEVVAGTVDDRVLARQRPDGHPGLAFDRHVLDIHASSDEQGVACLELFHAVSDVPKGFARAKTGIAVVAVKSHEPMGHDRFSSQGRAPAVGVRVRRLDTLTVDAEMTLQIDDHTSRSGRSRGWGRQAA
jgi:hypothetical protein